MSREQYQIPTTGGQGDFSGGQTSRAIEQAPTGPMFYTCGDCAVKVPLEKGAPIRCQKCGARVLYKERTKRMVQFEAR
ncbi:hypothetical protein QBC46DRAFT_401122 [Diplogelasinospora grovesii]|uniref:Metallothionein-I gene transcription activator n=1 Tax=Diplogelasinospora grovesii TaxID=303347 RepID=A0AAN6MXR1_9PEZI|nr:hypothetical protein QBC46DRAFT_401122 [Diplogelasinospora grovesii]